MADITYTELGARDLQEALRVLIEARHPAFVWGHPGTGKSDNVRQLAASIGGVSVSDGVYLGKSRWEYGRVLLIDVRASQWDAVDTRGVPFTYEVDGKRLTGWANPDFLPDVAEASKYDLVILFLDELNSAFVSVQAALYQLILDRQLGDYRLPDNVYITAAGNMETDKAVTSRMSTALADRFFHFKMGIDHQGWIEWANANGVLVDIVAFISWKPDLLYTWDAKSQDKAQATLRGWAFVSNALKVAESKGINGAIESALICGKIGEAVGREFIAFRKMLKSLPNANDVIADPSNQAWIGTDPSVNHALCGAIAARATKANIAQVITFAELLGNHPMGGQEYEAFLVKAAATRNPEIKETAAFVGWASRHDVL